MEQFRIALYVALGLVLLMIYQAWEAQRTAAPPPASSAEAPAAGDAPAARSATPAGPSPQTAPPAGIPATQPPPAPGAVDEAPARPIWVETDLLRAQIDSRGGTLRTVELLDYPVSAQRPDEPFALLADGRQGARYYVMRSGLVAREGSAPDHRAQYHTERTAYRLGPDAASIEVPLTWRRADEAGIEVRKLYRFERGSYIVEQRFEVRNAGRTPWSGSEYTQLVRRPSEQRGRNFFQPVSFQGAAYYDAQQGFEKVGYDALRDQPLDYTTRGGWVALLEHYFVAAIIPPPQQPVRFFGQALDGSRYAVGVQSEEIRLAPGETATLATRLFVGPKLQSALKPAAEGLILSVDYGYLTALAQPLFWLLQWIHGLVGNWGFAIIIVTLLIKLAFYRLSASSYRSMAKMRKLQPRLLALRERYGDDRQAMSQKMMELYKEEKFNPLGGCLPILVQIPVFIALYWVLLESVELRQAPFVGWIQDLSSRDPYFILPALMVISMVAQQRMNPAPLDPVQQKVMMAMPFVFGVFFALFPAGLVLYWLCNNLISIAQQWLIMRHVERSGA